MDNVCFLAWSFDYTFGASCVKFKTLADLNTWKNKYNVEVNAIHEYRNNHLYSIIFEDERGKSERIKVENKKREKEIEEERRRKLRQHLYIDFVNGHKYF